MSSNNATLPAAPAESPAPVPGAVSPAASSAAPASPEAPVALTTEMMSDRIREQLTGVKPAPTTPPVSGSEPSPETPGSPTDSTVTVPPPSPDNDPAHDDDDDNDAAELTPQALAALSQARKSKREAKAKAAALEAENRLLKEQLAAKDKPTDPNAPTAPKAPAAPTAAANVPPELAAAEQVEAEQEGLRTWARTQTKALTKALKDGDPTAVLQTMQAQVAKHGVTLEADPDAVLTWLDNLETSATDRLAAAQVQTTVLRQQVAQGSQALHEESRQLATEWAPQMAQAGSEASKRADLIRAQFPGLEDHPMGPRFLAAAVRGWEVITTEIAAKASKPAAPKPGKAVTLPAKPTAQLPGASATVPARPAESEASSGSAFQAYMRVYNDPKATEAEREQAKSNWVKAGLKGR